MKHEVIDNFLNKEEHEFLYNQFTSLDFHWYLNNKITGANEEKHNLYYWTHLFYHAHKTNSNYYEHMIENIFLEKLDVKSLIRAKANLYPGSSKLTEHGNHIDYPYEHIGAIYYINTNDGYTKLNDGTKIKSVANRLLKFDASKPHTSTDCTNDKYRININFNYF